MKINLSVIRDNLGLLPRFSFMYDPVYENDVSSRIREIKLIRVQGN